VWADFTLAVGTAVVLVVILARLGVRTEEHTSELQSRFDLVCGLLLEKKNATSEPVAFDVCAHSVATAATRQLAYERINAGSIKSRHGGLAEVAALVDPDNGAGAGAML